MSFAKFSIEVNGNKDSAILSSVKKSYVYPFNENLKFQQATSYFSSWKLHLGLHCSIFKDVQLAIFLIYSFLNFEPLFKPCSSKALGVATVFKSLTKIFGECLYSIILF